MDMDEKRKSRAQRMAETYPQRLDDLGVIRLHTSENRPPQPQHAADGTINWWTTILNLPPRPEDAD
jgi:hypothetical protein